MQYVRNIVIFLLGAVGGAVLIAGLNAPARQPLSMAVVIAVVLLGIATLAPERW